MRQIFFIIILFACLSCFWNCDAQWVQIANGMGNNRVVFSLIFSGNSIFAGLRNGYPDSTDGVWITTNNGDIWSRTSLIQGTLSLASNGNKLYAGTDNGFFLSTNYGANWTRNEYFTNGQSIVSITLNGNYIYAGELYSNFIWKDLYISSNSGMNWSISLADRLVNSVGINGTNIFAGTDGYGIYLSTNNGSSWVSAGLYGTVNDIKVNNNIIYAGVSGSGYNGVWISSDNGLNWIRKPIDNNSVLSLLVYGNYIIAGTQNNGMYLSTDNGTTWIQKNQGFENTTDTYILSLLISNNIIYAGTYGKSVWRRSLIDLTSIQSNNQETPSNFSLFQNYPNPFNAITKIKFTVAKTSNIKIAIFDIFGKEVELITNKWYKEGNYQLYWDASNYSSGVYICEINSEGKTEAKKMILLK